jgi:hypothetical protein
LLSWQTPDAKKLASFFAVFVETLSGQAFRRRAAVIGRAQNTVRKSAAWIIPSSSRAKPGGA